jgi:hypothetical protein
VSYNILYAIGADSAVEVIVFNILVIKEGSTLCHTHFASRDLCVYLMSIAAWALFFSYPAAYFRLTVSSKQYKPIREEILALFCSCH